MSLPFVRFMSRTFVTIGWLGATACSVPGCGQVEHGNVAFDVSPSGRTIVFSAADGDLYLFPLETRRVSALTGTAATESNPAFSPDGKAVIFSATAPKGNGSYISYVTSDATRATTLTDAPNVKDDYPSFSPDGSRIVFIRASVYRPYGMGGWTWDSHDVYVMSRDGTNPHRLTSEGYCQALRPRFINGGKTILFSADGHYPDTHRYLFTVPADGSAPPQRLTSPPASPGNFFAWGDSPSVSADGKRVAFVSDRSASFRYDLYSSKPNGTDARRLHVTSVSPYNRNPVFLPDGSGLLFLAGTEQNDSSRYIYSLWEVGIDGRNPRRIAESGLFTNPLGWAGTAGPAKPAAKPPTP